MNATLLLTMVSALMTSSAGAASQRTTAFDAELHYQLHAVPMTAVKLDGGFWADRLRTNAESTVDAVFHQCDITGRLSNFSRAAGLEAGEHEGYFFNDSDVYKAIEGAAYVLAMERNPELERLVDRIIDDIAAAQEDDGYLNTYYTLKEPDQKWTDIRVRHELYCAGHLFEAAVAYHEATGKRKLLDVALRFADHIDSIFGPDKRADPPGHQQVEMGLVRLYKHTGEHKYLDLAEFFIEQRGRPNGRELYGLYAQDHKPVTEQDEAVGHAVRGAYLYAGMADVAAHTGNEEYIGTIDRIWDNVVTKKMYITGGIGASRAGEAFGGAYELPNESAYAETCGAIANALWNHRMLRLHADAKYADVIERVIYNGFLVGVSLSGDRFFYPNPLATDGVTPFNHGSNERSEWFACACCPVNVVRFIPSLTEYMYSYDAKNSNVYVNLFADSVATIDLPDGELTITQETEYPWDGRIALTIESSDAVDSLLHVRIPGWSINDPVPGDLYEYAERVNDPPRLFIDGVESPVELHQGYTRIRGPWDGTRRVELELPMPARRVISHPSVATNEGLVAIERGPIVYCLEAVDHEGRAHNIALPDDAELVAERRDDLLDGVVVLKAEGRRRYRDDHTGEVRESDVAVTAVPYYAWNHRGPGEMTVWVPRTIDRVEIPPPPTIASKSRITASHTWSSDTPWAVNDQEEPTSSSDESIPRHTWWPRRGSTEWIQMNFDQPERISAVEVYWFDDTGHGQCRLPQSWTLHFQDGDQWKPVPGAGELTAEKDQFTVIEFPAISTTGLRIEADLREGFSGGVLEWKVR